MTEQEWGQTTNATYDLLVDLFDPFFLGSPVALNDRGEILLSGRVIARFDVETRIDIAKAKLHGLVCRGGVIKTNSNKVFYVEFEFKRN